MKPAIAALLALLLEAGALAAAPSAKSRAAPAQLQEKVIAALGGDARLSGLKALAGRGRVSFFGGFPGRAEFIAAAPDKLRLSWDVSFMRVIQAIDGAEAWELRAKPRQLGGEELVHARNEARFNLIYRLLKSGEVIKVRRGLCAPGVPALLATVRVAGGPNETIGVDPRTDLPRCEWRTEDFEEGLSKVETLFSDYRRLVGLMLPFSIESRRPDRDLKLAIDSYEVNPPVPAGTFSLADQGALTAPIALSLSTAPTSIYKEPDAEYDAERSGRHLGAYFYSSESWTLDLIVNESHGRYLEPAGARAELYAGSRFVEVRDWSADGLKALARVPIDPMRPRGELYGFRLNFHAAEREHVSRILFTFSARDGAGENRSAKLEVPVTTYQPKTSLIFPIRGKFMVVDGHEYYELGHKFDESQQFALDIVALGPNFELARHGGKKDSDFVGWRRRSIIAPARGRVVYARNDLPDNGDIPMRAMQSPGAGLELFAGNGVILDHGNGEYSLFAHMAQGSVRVRVGQMVKQGQIIGLLGATAAPGHPHLHYQLQTGPKFLAADGLPLVFTNIAPVGWFEGERGSSKVTRPERGVTMEAH